MSRVQVEFFHTWTRPANLSRRPGPSPFIKRIFFLTLNPPYWASAGPVPTCPAKPKIKNTNFDLWFFGPKSQTQTQKSQTQMSDLWFPFQNHKPNTNFRSIIFPFKITNTNSNDWDELNPEKKNGDRGGARPWGHGQGGWEGHRAVRQCEIGDDEDETKLRE